MIDQPGSEEGSFDATLGAAVERDVSKNTLDHQLETILAGDWRHHLTTENYEEANQALAEVQALKVWRSATNRSTFREFYQLFEQTSRLNAAPLPAADKQTLHSILADRLSEKTDHLSPRAADLYQGLLAMIEGAEYQSTFPEVQQQLGELANSGDLADLIDPRTPIDIKLDRMQKRLEGPLEHYQAKDRYDRRQRAQEDSGPHEQPTIPPPAEDESKPGMDEMERSKEGEIPPAIWTISPAHGGYFKQQSFDTWDSTTNTWRQSAYHYGVDAPPVFSGMPGDTFNISAQLPAGQWTRLPRPYSHDVLGVKSQLDAQGIDMRRDQNGDYLILNRQATDASITLSLANGAKATEFTPPTAAPSFHSQFGQETITKIQEIAAKRPTNLGRARALAKYTRQRLKYSNDSQYNAIYNSDQRGYASAIDEHRQADCDVANTYFAALAAELRIPVRHVVGHMVKGKDDQGNARITSGTGHAWSEVWDNLTNTWERIDATPPGDQQLEENRSGEAQPPGDYGVIEALGPTDKELAELEEKLLSRVDELEYTAEELELAKEINLPDEKAARKEARRIYAEIQAAEDTRLPNGQRVVDVLSQLFHLIVETRKTAAPDYTGPLRQREGGEDIDDIVGHILGVRSGDPDPPSRLKPDEAIEIEQVFGGFDVWQIGDKSGSMSQTVDTGVDDEAKWKLQQRAETLILSSLYRFEQAIQRSRIKSSLSVRSGAVSFRGSGSEDLDLDKPLSGTFTPSEKVRFWQSLGNQGMGNGDVAALTYIRDQIQVERAALAATGKPDDRLRIIIACSDGYPDDEVGVRRLAAELGAMNAVVVGVGLTETAAAVPVIFNNPPYSRGDLARDINDLPLIVAKHVVTEAIKLFPKHSLAVASGQLKAIIAKFSRGQ